MHTWAIVLAAGSGSRFGGDKLMSGYRGLPLVVHCLDAVRQAIAARILAGGVVVCRADHPVLPALAAARGFPTARLPGGGGGGAGGAGIGDSLRSGLSALQAMDCEPQPDGALIVPGDQPCVRVDVIRALLEAVSPGTPVVRPVYHDEPGTPGHPVWLARALWPLAQELAPDEGFARVLVDRGIAVHQVPVAGRNPDVDTRERLASLESEM